MSNSKPNHSPTKRGNGTMNRKRTYARLVGICALGISAVGLGACDDLTLVESPPHIIVAENLYTDYAGFQAGLNAIYAQVRGERLGAAEGGTGDLRTELMSVGVDNAFSNYAAPTERIWNEWGIRNNPLEGYYLSIWTWLYQTINAANTIIERAENPDVRWTEAQKNEVLAQAYLFRAWAYRHLTYLWGDVPLNLKESTGASIRTDWERTPRQQVWEQMEKDLLFAEQYLPAVPPSPGRLAKAVAQHYLAELYLVMGQPAKAEEKAAGVVNGGQYRLITSRYGVRANQPGVPFMDQFYEGNAKRSQGNTEVLWLFPYQLNVPGGGSSIMRRFWVNRYYNLKGVAVSEDYGGRAIGRLTNTSWALKLYEPQDDRGSIHAIRTYYLYNTTSGLPAGKKLGDTLFLPVGKERINNATWPSTRKWDWADPLNVTGAEQHNDQPYLRLAETYLLLAEAYFRQGKLAQAAATINVLRARANASPITAGQVTLDFILDERSRELLTEEQRRYTLLRTGTWLERTARYNPIAAPNIVPRDTLFPIPQAVIDANLTRQLEQNPGY